MRNAVKLIIVAIILLSVNSFAQPKFTDINSKAGAFSRMGFGARGIGMGNAMSSVTTGNLVSYYNPAVSPFQENNSVQLGYSVLSLDRSLNFLSFTRKFDFYSSKDTSIDRKPIVQQVLVLALLTLVLAKLMEGTIMDCQQKNFLLQKTNSFLSVANDFLKNFQ